jgi:hypothetical protein
MWLYAKSYSKMSVDVPPLDIPPRRFLSSESVCVEWSIDGIEMLLILSQ